MKKFNLRVYVLIINKNDQILLADEEYDGKQFTKFPGGGVEWGEGIVDALQREALEELHQPLKEVKHFYTTEFFQRSAFRQTDQIISIYYTAQLTSPEELELAGFPFDFTYGKPAFRWVNLSELRKKGMKFPIDQVVLEKLTT